MSSLQQLLDRRRSDESATSNACYSLAQHAPTLSVQTSADECWVLPWPHLVAAVHSGQGARQQLVITFPAQEVTLRGAHLAALRDAIAAGRLCDVRPAPGKYDKAATAEPFIDAVHVVKISDAESD